MFTHPTQTLEAPGCPATEETWVYTDGESVQCFPVPGATQAVLVRHPKPDLAPPGVKLRDEILSFARHFFRVPKGPT